MKTVKAVRATHICVTCGENDSVDIRCGGPATLGYDFYVDPKEAKKLVKHVKAMLEKYERPCENIDVYPRSDLMKPKEIWTANRITRCIKNINPI